VITVEIDISFVRPDGLCIILLSEMEYLFMEVEQPENESNDGELITWNKKKR
jgi:hypothetical protein